MSQATIAAGRRMSTARCYLDPIRKRPEPAHRDRRADRGAAARRQALHRRALFGRRRRCARRARRARSWSAPARSTRRNCWSCRASASPSGCSDSASRCATRCPASARTCATITRRARAGLVGAKGITFNDRGARPRPGAARRCATRCSREGMLGMVGAPMRAFVRSREGLEAPDLLLGWVPMLTEPGPKGPQHRAASPA